MIGRGITDSWHSSIDVGSPDHCRYPPFIIFGCGWRGDTYRYKYNQSMRGLFDMEDEVDNK